jgi:hypothetical protein
MLTGRKILGLGREPINLSGGRLARVRYAPITDKIARRSEMTRCATTGRSARNALGNLRGETLKIAK